MSRVSFGVSSVRNNGQAVISQQLKGKHVDNLIQYKQSQLLSRFASAAKLKFNQCVVWPSCGEHAYRACFAVKLHEYVITVCVPSAKKIAQDVTTLYGKTCRQRLQIAQASDAHLGMPCYYRIFDHRPIRFPVDKLHGMYTHKFHGMRNITRGI